MAETTAGIAYGRIVTIPNVLTALRFLAGPVLVWVLFVWWPENGMLSVCRDALMLGIYSGACILDFLDGYIARAWNQQSRLGKILDPIADKVLVLLIAGFVAWTGKVNSFELFLILIILGREISIMLARHGFRIGESVEVSRAGKWKAGVQMVAVGFFLIRDGAIENSFDALFFQTAFASTGTMLLVLAAVLTILSGIGYAQAAWRDGAPIFGGISALLGFTLAFLLTLPFWGYAQ